MSWPPTRRHRMAGSPSIWASSNVAGPSGPANDQVISRIPGALCTRLIRSLPGQWGSGRSTCGVRTVNVADSLLEEGGFVATQPRVVSDKRLVDLVFQTEPSRSARKGSASLIGTDPTGCKVGVRLLLHLLPALRPEPRLRGEPPQRTPHRARPLWAARGYLAEDRLAWAPPATPSEFQYYRTLV